MRIAHVILKARYSGAEILARDLSIRALPKGDTLAIVSLEPPAQEFEPEIRILKSKTIEVFHPANALRSGIRRTLYLRKFIAKWCPDVILGHSILPSLYCRMAGILAARCRVLSVLHSNSDLSDWKLKAVERVLAWRNEKVIGVSNLACQNYTDGIKTRTPVVHIPNGIDVERFTFTRESRIKKRCELALSDNWTNILQIGRICLQKQQLATIKACRDISSSHGVKIHLFLAGPVESQQAYADSVLAQLSDQTPHFRISYLGSRSDISELLAAADLCVMPSAWEAHSIAALEAAASGIALVLSDIDDFRQIGHMSGIFIFDPNDLQSFVDAIRNAIATVPRRFHRQMEQFAIENCAQSYDLLLRA